MSKSMHPEVILFDGVAPPPVIAVCEHFAGSRKLMEKAFAVQREHGPVFDITCDCEDGAASGEERNHALMIVELLNSPLNHYRMAGARIHDYTHGSWRTDVEILVGGSGHLLSHITLPKATAAPQVAEMIEYIRRVVDRNGINRMIPIHVLIETQRGLRDVWDIAALDGVRVMDFGLMDFISDHHGAIPARCMRSPGQFEHHLLVRAKGEIVAAALAHGLVPSHNVTLDLKQTDTTYRDALRARNEFGFLRMWSIHPNQIRAIIDAMKPDLSEINIGTAILLAAQHAGWGPIRYDGELHDRASYRYYWQTLKKARATGVSLPPEAEEAFFSRA